MKSFTYRGVDVIVWKSPLRSAYVSKADWKNSSEKITLFNKINAAARSNQNYHNDTIYIRQRVRDTIANAREEWKSRQRSQTTVEIEVKRNLGPKEAALLGYYNRKMFTNLPVTGKAKVTLSGDSSPMLLPDKIFAKVQEINQIVRNMRSFARQATTKRKVFTVRSTGERIEYTLSNGVFSDPGTISKISERMKARKVFMPKRPITNERHIAAEIECFGPKTYDDLGIALMRAGLSNYVELKRDGSIRPNTGSQHSYELAVLAPASEFNAAITKISAVLKDNECSVNRTCGLHVHLDARAHVGNADKMFSNLVSSQAILYKMQPPSRRANTYCERTESKDLRKELGKGARYKGINPMSYRKHNTIEVRLHSGTIDAVKIINFVTLLQHIAYSSKEIKRGASTVAGLVKQHELPSGLARYISERVSKFSGATEVEEST
jgi:hypothetical protein